MAKVEVIADVLNYTDKNNVHSIYVKGQVFDMDEEYLEQNLETVPPSADGLRRSETALGGRPAVRLAKIEAKVSEPMRRGVMRPAPAPKPAGSE